MGELIRSLDWSQTPLGPVESWPQSLRTTVSLCLSSTFPILIAWGPERVQIYNDTYRPICGDKHPRSMGQRFNECWASALPAVGHVLDGAQAGRGSYLENLRMFLDRHGYLEEAFMTFSFSPIRDESGKVGGLFHPITETTDRMLGSRRTQVLRDLAADLAQSASMTQLGENLARSYETAQLDLPFLLFYSFEGAETRLLGQAGFAGGAVPAEWPLDRVRQTGLAEVMEALPAPVVAGPYEEPVRSAVLLPVHLPGQAQPVGCLVAGVSVRRALDATYRAFYDSLARVLSAQVASIRAYEQEQARAAALAELDRAKTTFFSNVSHEFRTPLTLMLGPVDGLLQADGLAEPVKQELLRVQRNGQRLLKLVNSLLDFSRIEAGRVQAAFEPVDLAAVSADLASTFRSLLEKAGLSFEVDAPQLQQPVWLDRGSYEKILLNLLSNAFKFTFQGGVRVSVRERDGAPEVTVTDTGVGVPAEEVPRLFERFHRVQGAQGRSFEGSGIGLALVQELVKLHGGEVHAESTPGSGTTFTVRLRYGTEHLAAEKLQAAGTRGMPGLGASAFVDEAAQWIGAAPAPRPERPAASGAHVLLADDNADMRDYVRRLLEPRFEVETVADGVSALGAARLRIPDLVLSDVMMPGLDGFGLLAALRADPRTAHVPVILLSARAGEESTIEGLQAGANDYLVKPFSAQELLARVEGNVRTAHARQDLDAFAGRIAHDLRNLLAPLSYIAAQVKLGGGPVRKVGERLERLSRRSQNLLDGMLAFSRAGGLDTNDEPAQTTAVVADISEDLGMLVESSRAQLDISEVDDLAVELPRGLLYVVLLNLLQNSLKFVAGRPERRVAISAHKVEGSCELRVTDTGPGIAPEVLPHVFEPFYRAPGQKASGHGIGLATVQRIVRAAGGTVSVSSVPGKGAAFTITVPLR